jgi:predicted nucleic acid-binding protein
MGADRPRALVLDTGALIAIERRERRVAALIATANRNDLTVVAPAGVLAQAWRGATRQALLARALQTDLEVDELTAGAALRAGVLCGRTATSDVIDASVALSARNRDAVVLTSDPDDLRRLDPLLQIEVC